MANAKQHPQAEHSPIPEFCGDRALTFLMLVMELVAAVLTLAGQALSGGSILRFLALSIYLQAITVCGAVILCKSRERIAQSYTRDVFVLCWVVLVAVVLMISEVAWELVTHLDFGIRVKDSHFGFLLRSTVVGGIVSLLLLRYFWDRYQWREQMRTDADARYLALQARIRPHFLFNALNSLAALVRTRPDKAEDIVLDLSDLFRVSLDSSARLITLREEIEIVQGYLRIEEIRLGDRLVLNWEIPEELLEARIPRLILQPLVENAVLHGISRLTGTGLLNIIATRQGRLLIIDVENPLPDGSAAKHKGTGVATDNIRERLRIIYGNAAQLYLSQGRDGYGALFRSRLLLPLSFDDPDAGATPQA